MIRLSVPYSEKDIVKQHGARWNGEGRFWFYPGTELPKELEPWVLKAKDGAPDHPPLKGQMRFPLEAGQIFPEEKEESCLTVSQLSQLIREDYYQNPLLRQVAVQGEVCNLDENRPQDGSSFISFGLKDAQALLHCVLWPRHVKAALAEPVRNGQLVMLRGTLDYYEGQGRTQLTVKLLRKLGLGDASQALLELKKKLEAEGLFSPEWKKPIPRHPEVVGILTSSQGQAFRDIRDVAGRRNPYVQLVLYPVMVQGKGAAESIVKGLHYMDAYGADVLIIGRGGGSEEELSAYNDEALVRAVFEARTPIVSAVGHAGNWSLMDLVADARAATPSEAAELSVPDVMTALQRLQALKRETAAGMKRQLLQKRRRLEAGKAALEIYHPRHLLEKRKNRLLRLREILEQEMDWKMKETKGRLAQLKEALPLQMKKLLELKLHRFQLETTRLHSLSPTAKLVQGFGYIEIEGKPLRSVAQAHTGDRLQLFVHDGTLEAQVDHVRRREKDV